MNEFTHHNTCINLLDVIIHKEIAVDIEDPILDTYGSLKGIKIDLDDTVHISPGSVHPKKTTPTVEIPKLMHPKNLQIVPVLLDDIRHLSILE
jgi:hypothetical protein